jgi:hypothetical protein
MSEPRLLRCYQYINRPYEEVRNVLRSRPLEILQRATMSAAARGKALMSHLSVEIGKVEVGVDVRTCLHGIREDEGAAGLTPVTRVDIGWEAAGAPTLFPVMRAQLSVWPLTSTETQLELEGAYAPPLGLVGKVIDAAIGHRVAEAAVHRFLEDAVEQLRRELPGATP